MTHKKYSGLAIGGVADGKRFTSESPTLRLDAFPQSQLFAVDSEVPEKLSFETVEYRHVAFWFSNSEHAGRQEDRGFWAPSHVSDQYLYVLDHLIAAYTKETTNGE